MTENFHSGSSVKRPNSSIRFGVNIRSSEKLIQNDVGKNPLGAAPPEFKIHCSDNLPLSQASEPISLCGKIFSRNTRGQPTVAR